MQLRIAPVSVAALALALAPSRASAEERGTRWYGWQILAADATVALGSAVILSNTEDDDVGASVLLGGLALSAPVVHALNGHLERAPTSLGIRVGAPLLTAWVFAHDEEGWDRIGAAAGGFIVGGVVAEAIDLFRATAELADEAPVQPMLKVSPEIAVVGATGRF
jgi:hypothetical protein